MASNLKRIWHALFVLLFLTGVSLSSFASESQGRNSLPQAEKFNLKLSPQEKAYIKKHPVIRVSNEMDYPPFDFAIEGQPQGYTIDLLDLLAEKIGIRIEYVNGYTWAEIVQLFRQRKLDLLHSLVKTEGRSKFMLFSDRFFRDRQMYITRKEQPDITNVTQLYGKTISQGKGWSTVELLQKNYPQIPLLMVDNLEAMLSAVAYGKVDATIADEAATTYMIKQKGMSDLKLSGWAREFDQLGGLNFHFAGQMDAPELISMLNKALASLSVEELDGLQRKWFGEEFIRASAREATQTTTNNLPLSPAEKNYLENKKEITMCIDPDWAPYEMIDDNGDHVGLTADYFDVFRQMIPIPIKLVKTETWDESMQFAKERKCDILSMLSKSPERSKYLNFTEPYIKAKVVLVARNDVVYLDGLQSLSGKTLAIVKNYIYEEIVKTNYPEIKIIPVKNHAEGVQKVSDGSAYATIGSLMTILPQIQKQGLSNLKIAGPANLENQYRIGARKDEPLLASIFDKAIKSIDQETENKILRRWYTVSVEENFNYSLLWKIGAAALLILAVVLYWNRRLSILASKLNKAKDEAEAANRAKSTFLTNMSHELRTPLNIILGFSQLMFREQGASEEQRKNLKSIMQSGEHLLGLINDVLELSKIEAGKIELCSESFDLHRLLSSLEGMFRLNSVQKGLTLEVSRGTDVPKYIRTDRSKLSQVLINLLTNAVKFTDQGKISLDVQRKEQQDAPQENKCHLHFTVSDTGIGIPKNKQEKIFDTFFQTEGQQATKSGTGLGLSISRKFVELLGGTLSVESVEGQGSRFHVDIPVEITDRAEQQNHFSKTSITGLAPGQPAVRLLVAEDNPDNRDLLVTLLRSVGFEVREAVNGREAITVWQEWQPHLIWMDLRMPEVDGMQAITEIRKLPGGKNTKIIALTAHVFEEDRQHVLENGGDDFLRKPFTETDMFHLLEKHLGVQFQYAETENVSQNEPQAKPLKSSDILSFLKSLPDDLYDRLKQAIALGEVESIENIINEISLINPEMGKHLKGLADDFAYDEIAASLDTRQTELKQ